MTLPAHDRDGAAVDALIADRYLEALLAAADRRADDAPADASLDPALREAVRVLRAALVRVHPSFRFEERLAGRLAALAAAQARGAPGAAPGVLVPFSPPPPALAAIDPELAAVLDGRLDPAVEGSARPGAEAPGVVGGITDATDATDASAGRAAGAFGSVRRPVLLGGAVASAALSILGVVVVAWRTARPGRGPMARAARVVHGRRLAAAAADLASGAIGAGRPA